MKSVYTGGEKVAEFESYDELRVGGGKPAFIYEGNELVYPNPVKEGLVLWYDFSGRSNTDGQRGIAEDLSGNGNHGTLQNFNFTPESGYDKNKLLFDGVDDYVGVDVPISDFTITFSLEMSGADDQFFFGGDINTFYLRRYLGDRLHASVYTDTQKTIQSLGVFKNTGESEKHSVGLILDSQRLKVGLIHNGIIMQEEDLTSSAIPFTLKTLGQWSSDSRRFSGGIFSVSIYNRPLTPEEIAHNYVIEKDRFIDRVYPIPLSLPIGQGKISETFKVGGDI